MEVTLSDIKEMLPYAKTYAHYVAGLCPYHTDSRPSLIVTEKRYKCKSCGATGNLARLYKTLNPFDPRLSEEPPKRFGGRALPPYSDIESLELRLMEANDNLVLQGAGLLSDPFAKRGIFGSAIMKYDLGWYKNWLTIPIYDENHRFMGAVARANKALTDKGVDKYDTPSGQPPMLYVPDWTLWKNLDKVFITFGMFDAISLATLGYAAASPSVGQDSTNPDWLDDVRKPIYVVPDKGEMKAALKLVRKLGFRGKILRLPYEKFGCNDPNDFLIQEKKTQLIKFIEDHT